MAEHCHCGCCEGADALPGARHNAPGEPAVAYRAGTHATFKASLLSRLSRADKPALASLRTRQDDDFTIATCDAAATMLDVLTFYQERYANEFYLRTATERRSIVDLARLIGYQPSPGVAAGTHLMFQLEEAPGAPALAAEPVTIPIGTRVQSVPGPGEEPQTFETIDAVTARVAWNAIPAQTAERQIFTTGTTEIVLSGISVQVQSGDVVLVVGDERLQDATSNRWDARVVDAVERDNERGLTWVTLAHSLGQPNPPIAPAKLNPRVFIFRQRAALFGHNAPDPNLMFNSVDPPPGLTEPDGQTSIKWANFAIQTPFVRIDLDSSYPKILAGSWLLLTGGSGLFGGGLPSLPGRLKLCRVKDVRQMSRSAFALSGRITSITPDTTANLEDFQLRLVSVFAQSEELALAKRPLGYPLYGAAASTARPCRDLTPGRPLGVSGRRQRAQVMVDDPNLVFRPDGAAPVTVKPRDSFVLTAPPAKLVWGIFEIAIAPPDLPGVLANTLLKVRWRLMDRDGRTGTIDAPARSLGLQSALADDPIVRELCVIHNSDTAVTHDRDRTTVELIAALANVYDRHTVTFCANIARATHGETVSEIAGSGIAAVAGQRFLLKQAPLTYVSAATAEGRASTLAVRVDGLLWKQAPTLFEQGANAHVYALRHDNDGRTIVQFGDGVEGARLATGQDNLRFSYRKFLGSGGNLAAGRLTTLLGRPLGVKAVSNVTPASGGEDAESLDDARRNAPLTMLTLGRAVSLQDYTDFARSFAGIDKALAGWAGNGSARGILVTVAGPDGAAVPANSATMANLVTALRDYGDPLMSLTVRSYRAVRFKISARIKVADDAEADAVLPAVEAALHQHYSFAARDFGETVSIDEVMAVIHRITGVVAADVDLLYRTGPGVTPKLIPRLFAFPVLPQSDGTALAAELLTLDPGPVTLGVMP